MNSLRASSVMGAARDHVRRRARGDEKSERRMYEVLTPRVYEEDDRTRLEGYLSLGIYEASSPRVACNKALRAVEEDPFDCEGEPLLSPDPTLIPVPLRRVVPLSGLKVPQGIIDSWMAAAP